MITNQFHKSNRQKLANSLNGGVVILTAFTAVQRDSDSAYPFVQESNFWWLTGINKPDWWLIIDGSRQKSWLVSPAISSVNQVFNGSLSDEEAISISGVDYVITRNEALDMIRDLSRKHSVVYTIGDPSHTEYFDFTLNPAPRRLRTTLARTFNDVQDCRLELSKLRAIKEQFEINAMKKAIKYTINAFNDVKQKISSFDFEYQIESEFTYSFLKNGTEGHAFEPVVAGGENACTLHYSNAKSKLKKRDLVLMDIGAKYNGYPADITRTYSLGEPTQRQIEVHKAVDSVRRQTIDLISPNLSMSEYQELSDKIMLDAIKQLGLYKTADDFRRYFPHSMSHGLGVDTHDSLGRHRTFLPGMVLTVEPGIYIPEEKIGVRIEDDILVTDSGNQNLTSALKTDL